MNKNLIYIVAIGIDLHKSVIDSWKYYCNKYGIDFEIITDSINDKRSPHWERYTVFERFPEYDNYIYVDSDALVHWDAPDFFETLNNNEVLYAVKDIGSLEWVYNGILGYKKFFPNVNFRWDSYFNTGFLKFSQSHKKMFADFLKFHDENESQINIMQYSTLKKGFDQTPFNYFVRDNNISFEILPEYYSLGHLIKKDIFQGAIFLKIPCYIWQFNGIDKSKIKQILDIIWNKVNTNYI